MRALHGYRFNLEFYIFLQVLFLLFFSFFLLLSYLFSFFFLFWVPLFWVQGYTLCPIIIWTLVHMHIIFFLRQPGFWVQGYPFCSLEYMSNFFQFLQLMFLEHIQIFLFLELIQIILILELFHVFLFILVKKNHKLLSLRCLNKAIEFFLYQVRKLQLLGHIMMVYITVFSGLMEYLNF